MNLEAVYGSSVAQRARLQGAAAVTGASIVALPAAVSPLDTVAALDAKKSTKPSGLSDGAIFLILLAALVVWIWWGRRKG
jgi:hypothetical protein